MSGPDDAALANMATEITLARQDFEILFDELGKARDSRTFKITALLSPRHSPFLEALKTARDDGWFDELAERLLVVGAFGSSGAPLAPPSNLQLELQGMVQPRLGMFAVGTMNIGTINAIKRVCRIDVDGDMPSGGTGFLIGPQAVLTARHVIEPLLEHDGLMKVDSATSLTVIFDEVGRYNQRRECGVTQAWLVDSSDRHESEIPDAPYASILSAPPESFASRLDYAVLRLDKPVGRERGFYRLDHRRYPCVENTGGQITLFQHPRGDQMHTVTGAGLELWPEAIRTRLRHNANALDGTSGGLILDKSFEPVAMHQCTFRDEAGVAKINGAIPTACIAGRLPAGAVEQVIGLDPIWRIEATGYPVVGRESFQRCAMSALAGTARIIAVRGNADSGKSFSTDILRAMLDEGSNVIISLSAASISLEATRFAQQLLDAMQSAVVLPPTDDADTARLAWARDHLLPAILAAMRDYAGPRLLWLVIDDLDTNPIAIGSTTSMLERLYGEIGAYPFLRLLLIGHRGQVPVAKPMQTLYDDVLDLTVDEIADFISRKNIAEGHAKSLEEAKAMAALVMNIAAAAAPTRTAAIATTLLAGVGPLGPARP